MTARLLVPADAAVGTVLDGDEPRPAAYLRVSTLGQVRGHSLNVQECACVDYAMRSGMAVRPSDVALYADYGSRGGTVRRPSLERLLTDVGRGWISVVLVQFADRLGRGDAARAILTQLDEAMVPIVITDEQDDGGASYLSRVTERRSHQAIAQERSDRKLLATPRGVAMAYCAGRIDDVEYQRLYTFAGVIAPAREARIALGHPVGEQLAQQHEEQAS